MSKFNWRSLLADLLKVIIGALGGAYLTGCASIPVFSF